MARELELPNGETVTPEDVFLYENYPYRVQFPDDAPSASDASSADDASATDASSAEDPDHEFELSPLYWGGGEMDVPFRDREALVEQWGSESRGTMTAEEWESWLVEARHDDRFGDEELDAVARELPVDDPGLLGRLRRTLGL